MNYNDDWPEFDEEKRFDWSLPMREIERRYKHLVPIDEIEIRDYTKKPPEKLVDKPQFPTIKQINKVVKRFKSIPKNLSQLGSDASLSVNNNTPKIYHQNIDWLAKYLSEPQKNFHYDE